ncbi:MAG: hypothetical protein AB7F23_04935 [Phycisphaerae bacterium]|jgi:hypothetical protein
MRYFLIALAVAACTFGAEPRDKQQDDFILKSLVEDGLSIAGIEGHVRSDDSGRFLFVPNTDIEGKDGVAFSGIGIEILKCSLLEDIEKQPVENGLPCKVWGIITRYEDSNYILLNMALPLAGAAQKAAEPEDKPQEDAAVTTDAETGADDSVLPDDVFGKLSATKAVDSEKAAELDNAFPNKIVSALTGRFRQRGGECRFVPEARGAKAGSNDYEVLPCALLEEVPAMSRITPTSPKFRIAGIETEYKGKKYILLQRVVRKYSYGNLSGI